MTWNIKTGGYDGRSGRRLEGILAVVAGAAPDVFGAQELRAGAGPWLAERLGMRMVRARSWCGQPVALFVRPSWTVAASGAVRRPFHHAAAWARVGPLLVVTAHLDPYRGARRLVEARWLARFVRRSPLALVMGDLNTLDPWNDHTACVAALPPAYRRRHLRRGGRIETRAVAALESAGLVDVFRARGTGAGETAPTGLGGPEFSGMRLDYLFATPALAEHVRSCEVLRGGDTEWSSDHYPVVADLDLA